jgi:hypothetical protein
MTIFYMIGPSECQFFAARKRAQSCAARRCFLQRIAPHRRKIF